MCLDLQQSIVSFLRLATKKEVAEHKGSTSSIGAVDAMNDLTCNTIIEDRLDAGQIIVRSKEGLDRLKVKLLIEKALDDIKNIQGKSTEDYLVAENDEDPNEIAILKKGNIEQLGLFICEFCPLVFRSEIEKNIHQRIHYFGFG